MTLYEYTGGQVPVDRGVIISSPDKYEGHNENPHAPTMSIVSGQAAFQLRHLRRQTYRNNLDIRISNVLFYVFFRNSWTYLKYRQNRFDRKGGHMTIFEYMGGQVPSYRRVT